MSKKLAKVYYNQQKRDQLVRTIVQTFISEGVVPYDQINPILQKETGEEITTIYYNSLKTIIVRHLTRYVEQLVQRNFHKQINLFRNSHINNIRTPLFNCKEWMGNRQQETMNNLLRNCFLRQKIEMNKKEVLDFYAILFKLGSESRIRNQMLSVKKEEKAKELAKQQMMKIKVQYAKSKIYRQEKSKSKVKKQQVTLQKTPVEYSISSDE